MYGHYTGLNKKYLHVFYYYYYYYFCISHVYAYCCCKFFDLTKIKRLLLTFVNFRNKFSENNILKIIDSSQLPDKGHGVYRCGLDAIYINFSVTRI